MGAAWPHVQPEAPLHTQSSSQFAAHVWVFGDSQVVTEIRQAQRTCRLDTTTASREGQHPICLHRFLIAHTRLTPSYKAAQSVVLGWFPFPSFSPQFCLSSSSQHCHLARVSTHCISFHSLDTALERANPAPSLSQAHQKARPRRESVSQTANQSARIGLRKGGTTRSPVAIPELASP